MTRMDLLDLLKLLKVAELKTLCKHFNVRPKESGAPGKDSLIMALLSHASQRTLFGNLADKIKKRVMEDLGDCVSLCEGHTQVVNRLVVLATYPYFRDEEEKRLTDLGGKLARIRNRTLTYPSYVPRPHVAFLNHLHLIRYTDSLSFMQEYNGFVESKDWESAAAKVLEAKDLFGKFEQLDKVEEEWGGHLSRFTAGYQYCRCLSSGVSVLKRLADRTDQCLSILSLLLRQSRFLQKRRGQWYEELALVHTKRKDLPAAYEAVKQGLEDDRVDMVRKRVLSQRGSTLIKRKGGGVSDGMRAQLSSLLLRQTYQPPTATITAKSLEGVAGRKQVFYRDCDGGKEFSSVEEIVIDYYKNQFSPPYQSGLHDEGRTLMNLVVACFYDVIYSHPEGPSMFHCPLQTHPLDWGGLHFYRRRRPHIEETLKKLREGGVDEIMRSLERLVSLCEDQVSVVNWDYIKPAKLPSIRGVLKCMGAEVFLRIAEHVIRDYNTYHSGFPDLIMWDPPSQRCLLVEVKGPNDKLSVTQQIWLEKLSEFGANAIVCHVESKGSRKRKAPT